MPSLLENSFYNYKQPLAKILLECGLTVKIIMSEKKRMALLSLSILASLSLPVYAAEAPVQTRDIVVTATRTEQEVKDVPAAVEIITPEKLQSQGAATLRQALETATNISFGMDGMNGSTVSIRGSASRHVLILIDGKRISGEVSLERGNSFEIDRISMDNVERIEIIRGASSALYGSDAMGGVINIITKKPNKPQVSLEVEGHKANSLDDGRNWMLRYDAGKQGRLGWSLSAGERKEDPFIRSNGDTNNYYGTRRPFNFQGEWQTGEKDKITFGLDYLDEQTQRISGTTRYVNDIQRTDYNLGYEAKTEKTDYKIRLYQSVYEKDYESRNKNTGALNSFDVIKRTINTLEASASTAWRTDHLLTYGAEYREEKVLGTRIDSGNNTYTLHREGKSSPGSEAGLDYYAAYAQDEWIVDDRLLVVSALRYDDSDKFSSAVSPKLGMTYKLQPNSRLKANIGYGFKTPTTTELYHAFLMGSSTYFVGNPNLDPERSLNYDFGWEGEQGPWFGKLAFFRNEIKDMIASYATGEYYDAAKKVKIKSYDNIEEARMQGIEAEIGQKINDHFTLKLNYTYLDAEDKVTNARLTERSRHQIGASLLYADKAQGLNGSVWGTWKGNYIDDDNNTKSYAIWNALVSKELDKTTTIYVGVDNMFNYKDYDNWINGTIYRTGVKLKF